MMEVLIVEDEPLAAHNLKKQIHSYDSSIKIYPVADTIDQAVLMLKSIIPDLIFLDIELADGLSFEIFNQLKIKSPIIFTTAYDQYAIKAFEVNSIDYLLKPITEEKIYSAFKNYQNMKTTFDTGKLTQVVSNLGEQFTGKKYKESFLVKYGNKLLPIEEAKVAYFFAEEGWVYLVTSGNKKYLISYTLSQIEEQLNPQKFFRINRQYLIAKWAVDYIESYSKGQVCISLKPKTDIQVISRKTTPLVKEWLSS